MAKRGVEEALNRLKCSICINTFECPKTLPCMHTFCKDCLQRHITIRADARERELGENERRCAICRKRFTLSPRGVEDIPTNFDIEGIIEDLKSTGALGHDLLAKSDSALSGQSAQLQASPCVRCSTREVDCYCRNCNQLLCALCIFDCRKDHDCYKLNDAYDQYRRQLDAKVADLVTCSIKVNAGLLQNMEMAQRVKRNASENTSSIEAIFADFRCKLDERESQLLSAVEGIRDGKLAILEGQRSSIESVKEDISATIRDTSSLLNQANQVKLLSEKDQAMGKVTQQIEQAHIMHFEPDCDDFLETNIPVVELAAITKSIEKFGSVHCLMSPDHCTADGTGVVTPVANGSPCSFTVYLRDIFDNICRDENAVVAVCIQSNNSDKSPILDCVLAPDQNGTYPASYKLTSSDPFSINVTVNGSSIAGSPFDLKPSSYNFKGGIDFQTIKAKLHEPSGCTLGVNGEVIVADAHQNCVMIFDKDFELFRRIDNLSKPCGVAVDSHNKLYIADSGLNRIVVTLIAKETMMAFGTYGLNRGEFVLPCDVAVGYSKEKNGQLIYVADTYNNRVQVFNPIGSFVTEFGSKGTAHGQFQLPRGLTVNSEGLVFVCDTGNKRIQVFSADFSFIHVFSDLTTGSLPLQKPLGISCTQDGYVLIADSKIIVADTRGDLIITLDRYKAKSICCKHFENSRTLVAVCTNKQLLVGLPL